MLSIQISCVMFEGHQALGTAQLSLVFEWPSSPSCLPAIRVEKLPLKPTKDLNKYFNSSYHWYKNRCLVKTIPFLIFMLDSLLGKNHWIMSQAEICLAIHAVLIYLQWQDWISPPAMPVNVSALIFRCIYLPKASSIEEALAFAYMRTTGFTSTIWKSFVRVTRNNEGLKSWRKQKLTIYTVRDYVGKRFLNSIYIISFQQ